MAVTSAGVLLHRLGASGREVLLVHPGGPFWTRRDEGAWSIPKGEVADHEAPLDAARREFVEELGLPLPAGDLVPLGEVRLRGGKRVIAWSLQGDLDVARVVSNTFDLEWPPRSGRVRSFPEVDRAEWFALDVAVTKINAAMAPLVGRLQP